MSHKKPITFGDFEFASRSDACDFLGCTLAALGRAVKDNTVEELFDMCMAKQQMPATIAPSCVGVPAPAKFYGATTLRSDYDPTTPTEARLAQRKLYAKHGLSADSMRME